MIIKFFSKIRMDLYLIIIIMIELYCNKLKFFYDSDFMFWNNDNLLYNFDMNIGYNLSEIIKLIKNLELSPDLCFKKLKDILNYADYIQDIKDACKFYPDVLILILQDELKDQKKKQNESQTIINKLNKDFNNIKKRQIEIEQNYINEIQINNNKRQKISNIIKNAKDNASTRHIGWGNYVQTFNSKYLNQINDEIDF